MKKYSPPQIEDYSDRRRVSLHLFISKPNERCFFGICHNFFQCGLCWVWKSMLDKSFHFVCFPKTFWSLSVSHHFSSFSQKYTPFYLKSHILVGNRDLLLFWEKKFFQKNRLKRGNEKTSLEQKTKEEEKHPMFWNAQWTKRWKREEDNKNFCSSTLAGEERKKELPRDPKDSQTTLRFILRTVSPQKL